MLDDERSFFPKLNADTDVYGREPADVAYGWLKKQGFVTDKSNDPRPLSSSAHAIGPRVRHDRSMNSPTADHVVDALIAARLVDPDARQDSIDVVSGALAGPDRSAGGAVAPANRSLPQLVEVVAYLGGALVIAAGGLFIAEAWGDLGFAARVTMLGVVAAVLALAGGVAAHVPSGGPTLREDPNDSRRRLAGTLLTGAALAVACLVGIVVDEILDAVTGDIDWPAFAGAGIGVLVAAVGYRMAPTAVGLLGLMGGAVTAVMSVIGVVEGNEGDVTGVALFLISAAWLGLSEAGWFREITVARSLGVSVALVGAQVPVMEGSHTWFGYLLTVVVVVVGLAIYLGKVAWPYLAAAVIAVTLVVPEAVSDWTDGSFGAIGGVLVTGVTLLIASFAGYRLRAQAID